MRSLFRRGLYRTATRWNGAFNGSTRQRIVRGRLKIQVDRHGPRVDKKQTLFAVFRITVDLRVSRWAMSRLCNVLKEIVFPPSHPLTGVILQPCVLRKWVEAGGKYATSGFTHLKVGSWNVRGGMGASDGHTVDLVTLAKVQDICQRLDVIGIQESLRKSSARKIFAPGFSSFESHFGAGREAKGLVILAKSALLPKPLFTTPSTITVLLHPGGGARAIAFTTVYLSPDPRWRALDLINFNKFVDYVKDKTTYDHLVVGDFNAPRIDVQRLLAPVSNLGILVAPNSLPTRARGRRVIDHIASSLRVAPIGRDPTTVAYSDHYMVESTVTVAGVGGPANARRLGISQSGDPVAVVDRKLLTKPSLTELGEMDQWEPLTEKVRSLMGEQGKAKVEKDMKDWLYLTEEKAKEKAITVFTDGAFKPWPPTPSGTPANVAVGFGAFALFPDGSKDSLSGCLPFRVDGSSSNNRAEAEAVIAVLSNWVIPSDAPVVIVSDSQLVCDFIALGSSRAEALNAPVLPGSNDELAWRELDRIISERDGLVWVYKVKSHVGVWGNEMADWYAKVAAAQAVGSNVNQVFGVSSPPSQASCLTAAAEKVHLHCLGLVAPQRRRLSRLIAKSVSIGALKRRLPRLYLGRVSNFAGLPDSSRDIPVSVSQSGVDDVYKECEQWIWSGLSESGLVKNTRRSFVARSWAQYRVLSFEASALVAQINAVGRRFTDLARAPPGPALSREWSDLKSERTRLRRELEKTLKKDRLEGWKKTSKELLDMSYNGRDPRKLYSNLKRLGSSAKGSLLDPRTGLPVVDGNVIRLKSQSTGSITESDAETAEVFAVHYEALGKDVSGNSKITATNEQYWHDKMGRRRNQLLALGKAPFEALDPSVGNELDMGISEAEIILALRALKMNKAVGVDGLPGELLKAGLSDRISLSPFGRLIWHLCRLWWRSGFTPESLGRVRIVSLHKKGDKEDPGNYRGISITSSVYKVYASVLARRIQAHLLPNLPSWQAGFRVGEEAEMSVTAVVALIRQAVERDNVPIAGVFFDCKKAFPSIPSAAVLAKLELWVYGPRGGNGGPGASSFLGSVRSLYLSAMACAQAGKTLSREFKVERGVRQGCPLSPSLFLVVMLDMFDDITELSNGPGSSQVYSEGIVVGSEIWPGSGFADDSMRLVVDDSRGRRVKRAVQRQEKWASFNELGLHAGKSGVLIFLPSVSNWQPHPNRVTPMLNGSAVRTVEKTVYLGVGLDSYLTTRTMVEKRIQSAEGVLNGFTRLLGNTTIHPYVMSRILQVFVFPSLYYGASAWFPAMGLSEEPAEDGRQAVRVFVRKAVNMIANLGEFSGQTSRLSIERVLDLPHPPSQVLARRFRLGDKVEMVLRFWKRVGFRAWIPGGACLLPAAIESVESLPGSVGLSVWEELQNTTRLVHALLPWMDRIGVERAARVLQAHKPRYPSWWAKLVSFSWIRIHKIPPLEPELTNLVLTDDAPAKGANFVLRARVKSFPSCGQLRHKFPNPASSTARSLKHHCPICLFPLEKDGEAPVFEASHMLTSCMVLAGARASSGLEEILRISARVLADKGFTLGLNGLAAVLLGGCGPAKSLRGRNRWVDSDWLFGPSQFTVFGSLRGITYAGAKEGWLGGGGSVLARVMRFGESALDTHDRAVRAIRDSEPGNHPSGSFSRRGTSIWPTSPSGT